VRSATVVADPVEDLKKYHGPGGQVALIAFDGDLDEALRHLAHAA
jgi:hypothetical protein